MKHRFGPTDLNPSAIFTLRVGRVDSCDFFRVIIFNPMIELETAYAEILHFLSPTHMKVKIPYILHIFL